MILVASSDTDFLSEMESVLSEQADVDLLRAESARGTMDLARQEAIDLVIADEQIGETTGLELAAGLLLINPMITCSVVSGLSAEEFHEASEGLGIISQLPVQPDKEHVAILLERLREINSLTRSRN